MNPAEEIVKFWLQEKGYFVQSSVRVDQGRNREIDILAINKQGENKHIEVSVSVEMAHFKGDASTRAEDYVKKFFYPSIVSEVQKRLGINNYEKQLVVGDVAIKRKDISKEFIEECKKLDIKVILISEILAEIFPKLKAHTQLNPIIKTIQLTKKFLQ
jgi:hypothetical protein